MVWLALGCGVLVFGLWLLQAFAQAPPERIRRIGMVTLGLLGAGGLLLLVATGHGGHLIWLLGFVVPLLWPGRVAALFHRRFSRFSGGAGPTEAGASTVETATLTMRLEHGTGRMSGRVRRGPQQGRELAELALPELLALLADCRGNDVDSVVLLEAWLDRVAPDWRSQQGASDGGGDGGSAEAGNTAMTRAEALAVLGLAEGADAQAIRTAHRRLMRTAHPDSGGSDWLAARINQARDLLLRGAP